MANQIYQDWNASITVQAGAAITANNFSSGSQTVIDSTHDGGSENAKGATWIDIWINVTSAPSSEAAAEIWSEESPDNTNFANAQPSLVETVPTSTGYVYMGRHYIQAPYTKLKVKAISYGFTATVIGLPVTIEVQ